MTTLTTTVTPAIIATAIGRVAPDNPSVTYSQWTMWIADALMLIQARFDAITTTPAPTVAQAKLDYVIREAVVSHVRRPDDATQVSTSIDDGSVSKSYKSGAGRVIIRDEWWALLGLVDTGGRSFSIDTSPTISDHIPWCSLAFGANYCSCGTDIAGSPLYESGYVW